MLFHDRSCGCDNCINPTEYDPCGANVCAEHDAPGCVGGPCAFAALFGCNLIWPSPSADYLWTKKITVLWTDCKFKATRYTARKVRFDPPYDADCVTCATFLPATLEGGYPSNHMDPENKWVQIIPPYWDNDGAIEFGPLLFDCGGEGLNQPSEISYGTGDPAPYRCGWNDLIGLGAGCCHTAMATALEDCTSITWLLTIDDGGSSATLEGFIGNVLVVSYSCETFDCFGRSTFEMTTAVEDLPCADADGLIGTGLGTGEAATCLYGLPRSVCVVPYSANAQHPCLPGQENVACLCGDPGLARMCVSFPNFGCPDTGDLSGYFNPFLHGGSDLGDNTFAFPRIFEHPSWFSDPLMYFYHHVGTGVDYLTIDDDFTCVEFPDIESKAPCGVFGPILFEVEDYCGGTVVDPCAYDPDCCDRDQSHCATLLAAAAGGAYGTLYGPFDCIRWTQMYRKLLAFVYCDGAKWYGKVYCLKGRMCSYGIGAFSSPGADPINSVIVSVEDADVEVSCDLICDQQAVITEAPCPGVTEYIFECGSDDSECCPTCVPAIQTECCETPIPTSLVASLVNVTNCASIDGIEIPITWDGVNSWWRGSVTACGGTITVTLNCVSHSWYLDVSTEFCGSFSDHVATSVTCSPLHLVFDGFSDSSGSGSNPSCTCCDAVEDAYEWKVEITE